MSDQNPSTSCSLSEILSQAQPRLSFVSDSAALDVQVLLSHVMAVPRSWLLAHGEENLTASHAAEFEALLSRVESGEPLPYVLGEWEFYGLPFTLNPSVLIPRPETELLVQTALDWLRAHPNRRMAVDVGCGSGCIAVTIAKYFADITLVAIDISRAALEVTAHNAARHGVQTRVELVHKDLLSGVNGKYDLLCANLPYIPTATLRGLDIYGREPTLALNGGRDGLGVIRRLLLQAPAHIHAGGLLLLEIDPGQSERVSALASQAFRAASIHIRPDLARKPRLLVIEVPG